MTMPLQTLMPVMARDILAGGSSTLGLLVAALGIGLLLAGLYLAQRTDVIGLDKGTAATVLMCNLPDVALAFLCSIWLALPLAIVASFGMMIRGAPSNTLVQTLVEDHMRGRFLGFFTMAFLKMMPFGTLLCGALGDRFGVPGTLIVRGTACGLGAMWFGSRLDIWWQHAYPVYEGKGMLGAAAPGQPSDEG